MLHSTDEGPSFCIRPETSDSSIVMASFAEDEYNLVGRNLTGWAVDLGAHIGVIAVALLSRNPKLSVIAVEPLPDNVDLLTQNLAPFGDRGVVMTGAAGSGETAEIGYAFGGIDLDDGYKASNRYIGRVVETGNPEAVTVPVVTLASLVREYGEIAFVKTDCEGGEYPFFSDPKANAHVGTIVGEWHDDKGGSRIRSLLEPTHDFVRFEPFEEESCTGIFEAVRRD